jgi:hypothetical protein
MPRRTGGAYFIATISFEARSQTPGLTKIDPNFRRAGYEIMEK